MITPLGAGITQANEKFQGTDHWAARERGKVNGERLKLKDKRRPTTVFLSSFPFPL
jgi:hypothetical protein